jgi:ParB-like chromosome segregation protein Spo0J
MTTVSVRTLRTTLSPLRGERTAPEQGLAELPLRVAATEDGAFEVLDGFKRLARWTSEGRREVPVIVEPVSGVTTKARLLESNAPARTISAMDEARVVASLMDEDGLSIAAVGKLLGRKQEWVLRRLTLAGKLSSELKTRVDRGRLTLTAALALCDFPRTQQRSLADAIERHGLTTREAQAFLASYRVAPDDATREALARDPKSASSMPLDQGGSPLSPTAAELERRFDVLERELEELSAMPLEHFSDAETRVLGACRRRLAAKILALAHEFQEHTDEPGRAQGDSEAVRSGDGDPCHRPEARTQRQDDPPSADTTAADEQALEAVAVSGIDQGARIQGPDGAADSAGTSQSRVHREPDDPQGHSAADPRTPKGGQASLPAVRDEKSGRVPVGLEPVLGQDRGDQNAHPLLLDGAVLLPDAVRGVLPKRKTPDASLRAHRGAKVL